MKKTVLFLLFVAILTAGLPMTGFAAQAARGDLIEFGTYPQTDVTSELGDVLNGQDGEWISYDYYTGSYYLEDDSVYAGWFRGDMVASDYMEYKDVYYGGEKYRGVRFSQYRPYCTGYISNAEYSYQDDNGYYPDQTYWFKFEPITWVVIDPSTGFCMSQSVIDSQAFNNYVLKWGADYYGDPDHSNKSNNYAGSDIRDWLNNDFYRDYFTPEEQQQIIESTSDNSSLNSGGDGRYEVPQTQDKIFLPSLHDIVSVDDGFAEKAITPDAARRKKGSDYAKCQGLYPSIYATEPDCSENASWWLRSTNLAGYGNLIDADGRVGFSNKVNDTSIGIVPAVKLETLEPFIRSRINQSGEENDAKAVEAVNESKSVVDQGVTEAGNNEIEQKDHAIDPDPGASLKVLVAVGASIAVAIAAFTVFALSKKKKASVVNAEKTEEPSADTDEKMTSYEQPDSSAPPKAEEIKFTAHLAEGGVCPSCKNAFDQLYEITALKGARRSQACLCKSCATKLIRKIQSFNDHVAE